MTMANFSAIILTLLVFWGCDAKKRGQLNEDRLKDFVIKKEQRWDSTVTVQDFQLRRIDTLSQKEADQACERRYLSYLKQLELDTLDYKELGVVGELLTNGLRNNLKAYLLTRIDSVRTLIPNADSIKTVAYYVECNYRISNFIGSRKRTNWILVDNDLNVVEEDEYFGINDIIWNGPLIGRSKK